MTFAPTCGLGVHQSPQELYWLIRGVCCYKVTFIPNFIKFLFFVLIAVASELEGAGKQVLFISSPVRENFKSNISKFNEELRAQFGYQRVIPLASKVSFCCNIQSLLFVCVPVIYVHFLTGYFQQASSPRWRTFEF